MDLVRHTIEETFWWSMGHQDVKAVWDLCPLLISFNLIPQLESPAELGRVG
eukprot:CAMPEP_0179011974 /NCGR_PEP_ID=MMETSP0796-20121207/954_1 /TAXON_ID=73915 /ORGANISM="Pyrodinium bahamense, Strain pbaha01" /LENGTH=50 /DNA_ID=CAMNT_0020707397 /DNA_START=183 /DNA_END=335 /DNA_ORIENTATION=-